MPPADRLFRIVILTLTFCLAFSAVPGAHAAKLADYDRLPFKNNIEKNIQYAVGLYDSGFRDEAFSLFEQIIAVNGRTNNHAAKAEAHYTLGHLLYAKDRHWGIHQRDEESQRDWQNKTNLKAIKELTEYLRSAQQSRNRSSVRYDSVFKLVIQIFDEMKKYKRALGWLDRYEQFRNPDVYKDSIDFIKFTRAELLLKSDQFAEAYETYRQVYLAYSTGPFAQISRERAGKIKDKAKMARKDYAAKLLSQKKYLAALKEIKTYTASYPQDQQGQALKADIQKQVAAILTDPRHFEPVLHLNPRRSVLALAVPESDSFLAAGIDQAELNLWDLETYGSLPPLKGHRSQISALKFLTGTDLLISASRDRTIRVWDMEMRQEAHPSIGCAAQVHHLDYAPQSKTLLGIRTDGAVRLWRGARFAPGAEILDRNMGPITGAAFVDQGQAVLAATNRGLFLIDLEGKVLRKQAQNLRNPRLAASPSGRFVVMYADDEKLRLIDPAGPAIVNEWPAHRSRIYRVAFSADEAYLASAGQNKSVKIWSTGDWREIRTLVSNDRDVLSLAFSHSGRELFAGDNGGFITVYKVPD